MSTNFTNLSRSVQGIMWGYYGLSLETRDVVEYRESYGGYTNQVTMAFSLVDIAPVVALADTTDLSQEFGIDQKALREKVKAFACTTFFLDEKEKERCRIPQINLVFYARWYVKEPKHPFFGGLQWELLSSIHAVLLRLEIVPDPEKDQIPSGEDIADLIKRAPAVAKVELSKEAMLYVDCHYKRIKRTRHKTEETEPSQTPPPQNATNQVLPLDDPGAE